MTHRYDWSKLDAGWVFEDGILTETYVDNSKGAADLDGLWARRQWGVKTLEATRPDEASAAAHCQLAKCRIRDTEPAPPHDKFPSPAGDNTALFEAMDKIAAEISAEEWAKVPTYQMGATYDHGSMIAAYGAPPPPKWEVKAIGLSEDFTMWSYQPPPPPWRRGPLAAWTLVNISAHDGRLTVVMKRGRGEFIDETGPDDETLWERLAAKVVDYEKAKHAAK